MFKRLNRKNQAKPPKKRSFFAAIDRAIGLLFRMFGPMVAAAILTPHFSVVLLLVTALLCWLSARLGLLKIAKSISWSLTGVVLGTAFSFFYWLPFWLGAPLGVLMLLGGLAGQAAFERKLGIADLTATDGEQDPPASTGSAWQDSPVLTPEGEPLRCLGAAEIGMGGPLVASYLFPDGVLLSGTGTSMRFSADGRYFVAPQPSRSGWGLLVLDRHTRTVYRHSHISGFWEIDDVTETEVIGRNSPLTDNQPARITLQALLQPELAVLLEPVYDLWLEPGGEWDSAAAKRYMPAPVGELVVTAERYIPDALKNLDDPLQPLNYPVYRLQVDGQDSDLLIAQDEPVIWRADGQAFVCRAKQLDSQAHWTNDYWMWRSGDGWRPLPQPIEFRADEPVVCWGEAAALTADALIISGQFDFPEVNAWGYGHYLQHTLSDIETVCDYDPQGRVLLRPNHCSEIQYVLPLAEGAEQQTVRSALLQNGERAEFAWQQNDQANRLAAYSCRIGSWALAGLWLLDHRVSDCGRYIALVAFADAPAVAHRLVVADVVERCLIALQQGILFTRLVDFQGGELSLYRVLGRLSEGDLYNPLRRYDQLPPEPEQAASFFHQQTDARLYYEQLILQLRDGHLWPVPGWRVVSRPQVANAAGDFILPSPDRRDAAWLFGAETEYRDNYPREHSPRGGGCLLTASGIGMSDISPAMIWSEDGRYLAACRYVPRMACKERSDTDQWQLILIDTHERNWRYRPEPVGCMPAFTAFDREAVHVQVFAHDTEIAGDQGRVCVISLAELLRLQPESLHPVGPLWLPRHEAGRSGQWLGVDRSHLQGLCYPLVEAALGE